MDAVRIDDLLAPGYLAGLAEVDLSELRSRREECSAVETELSFLRRMVQGRLDIVLDERRRRRYGETTPDVASIVERLPEILAGSVHAPGVGRLPTTMAPAEVGPEATALLDAVVPPDRLVAIPGLPGAELDLLADALEAMEKEVSGQRRRLHAVLDALQGEVVRRYRSGEATVDGFFG